MSVEQSVADHYTTGGVLDRILAALRSLGVDPAQARPDDLKPVDEFHIGGVAATKRLLDQVDLTPDMHLLDIGCGIGGTPRFITGTYGCRVTGIDLTPDFIHAAAELNRMVGLDGAVDLAVASALDLPFDDGRFDAATLLHVGMNIPDKAGLMTQAARVLKPGGIFAVYDVMQTGDQDITYPVPWSERPETSFLATPDQYIAAAQAVGFDVIARQDRGDAALEFFAAVRARIQAEGPPLLGIHLLMGETAGTKVKNMVGNISAGLIAPTELILKKR